MRSKKLALVRETIRVLAVKTHVNAGAFAHLAHFDSKRWIGHTVIDCADPTTAPPRTAPRTPK